MASLGQEPACAAREVPGHDAMECEAQTEDGIRSSLIHRSGANKAAASAASAASAATAGSILGAAEAQETLE